MAKNEIRLHSPNTVRLPHPIDVSDVAVPVVFAPTTSVFYLLYANSKAKTTAEATVASPATVAVDNVRNFSNGDIVMYWEENAGSLARVTSTLTIAPTDGVLTFNLAQTLEKGRTIYRMVQTASIAGNTLYGTADVNTTNWGRFGEIPWTQPILVDGDEIAILFELTDAGGKKTHKWGEQFVVRG